MRQKTLTSLSVFMAAAIACSSISVAQTTWTGTGGNDNWFTLTNWDTGIVPDGSTFDVIIDAPAPTTVNGAPSINSLQLGSNGILNISQSLGFSGTAMNTLTSQGQINVNLGTNLQLKNTVNNSGAISSFGSLLTQSGGATLTGGGTVTLDSIVSISGVADSILTIENQIIEGRGQVGNDSIELINNGLIDANHPSGFILTLNPSAGGMVNTGTLQASGGGQLAINGANGGVFDNTGGTIQALADSDVELREFAEITGGTLTTSGTGIFTASGSPLLTNVTHAGNIAIGGGAGLRLSGAINNSGSISAVGSVLTQSGGVTLTGGGTVTLISSNAEISGVADATLTIEDQIIEGYGRVGDDSIELINNGLIDANHPSGFILSINPSAGGMVNTETLQASGGGQLSIDGTNGGVFDNTGGTIQALADSEVELRGNAEITGGTLTTSGTGIFFIAEGGTLLTNVTHTGNLEMGGGVSLGLSGTINNSGSIGGSLSTHAGGATLTGGGIVTLVGSLGIGGVSDSILTNEDQMIEGLGSIGNFQIGLINHGLIDANVPGQTLVINPSSDGVANTSTMQASGGGLLFLNGLSGGTFDNTGGTIQALSDSEVRYKLPGGGGPHIVGGLLTSTGTGFHHVLALQVTDVTNTGDILSPGGITMSGTFTNSGAILCTGAGGLKTASGGATLTGGGTVTFDSGFGSTISGVSNSTLIIEDQTIEGTVSIGEAQINIVNNAGSLIHANLSGGQVSINPVGGFDIPWISGEGTLRASNGGIFKSDHPVVSHGTIEVFGDSVFEFPHEIGVTCAAGSLLTGDGTVEARFGGVVLRPIRLNGTVAPGNSTGELLLIGSPVTFGSTAELQIELASASSFDVLDIFANSLTLDGTLTVTLLDGFIPDASDTFEVVQGIGPVDQFGEFSNVADGDRLNVSNGSGSFEVNYAPPKLGVASVILSDFQPSGLLLGDVNLDGFVNLFDVAPFVDHIVNGTYQAEADVDQDGDVDLFDVAPFVDLLIGG